MSTTQAQLQLLNHGPLGRRGNCRISTNDGNRRGGGFVRRLYIGNPWALEDLVADAVGERMWPIDNPFGPELLVAVIRLSLLMLFEEASPSELRDCNLPNRLSECALSLR